MIVDDIGGKGILDDSRWFWNHLESTFTIFYHLLPTDRHRFLYIDLAWFSLTEWFCSFFAENNEQTYKMVYSFFWKMSIHSSQIGLVLQNGFVFLGGELSQMGLCAEQLYKMVLMFFFQKMKNTWFFSRNTTKWFYMFFGDLARDWVWLYKMALVLFKKQRIHLQNGL